MLMRCLYSAVAYLSAVHLISVHGGIGSEVFAQFDTFNVNAESLSTC